MRYWYLLFLGLCWNLGAFVYGQEMPKKIVLDAKLKEISGLIYLHPDTLLCINDSGNDPTLFYLNTKGDILFEQRLPIENVDWEALAFNGESTVYIGDFGNNCNCRRDLKIYAWDIYQRKLDSIAIRLGDQKDYDLPKKDKNFDLEAMIYSEGNLHLYSKNNMQKGNYFVKHYTIDSSLDSSVIEVRDSFLLKKKVVTGASLSPLDHRLALVSYRFKRFLGFIPISSAAFFVSEEGTAWGAKKFKKKKIVTLPFARQWEAITWLNEKEVLIATEANGPFRAQIRRLKID